MSRPQKPRKLVILGAGAQGQNIHDVCTDLGVEVVGFLDDTKAQGEIVNGVPVLGGFDAMTRPLGDGRGLTSEAALDEIRNGAGTQFDPEIAAAFERLALEGEITTD